MGSRVGLKLKEITWDCCCTASRPALCEPVAPAATRTTCEVQVSYFGILIVAIVELRQTREVRRCNSCIVRSSFVAEYGSTA